MELKTWKPLIMNIILMIIFTLIVVTLNLKMSIMEIDLNYFILPIFCAVLFGCVITYLFMKRIRYLEKRVNEKTEELKYHTSMDELTNTYNRKMGLKMLKNHFDLSRRHKNSLSVCLIDLNGLKFVNEKFGRPKGDELIRDVSEMLRSSIRESDMISRVGGDEFLTVLPECDTAGARIVMRRLRDKIKAYNEDSQNNYSASINFGISESSYSDNKTVEYLLLEADNKRYVINKRKKEISHEKSHSPKKNKDNVLIFKLWVIVL